MRRKISMLLYLLINLSILSGYSIGERKSQYFLRWGITLADYLDTVIARRIDFVTYEEGGTPKNLNFVLWTPYDKVPVKRFIVNKIPGAPPQKKYGWLMAEGYGVYQTASMDDVSKLSFSPIIPEVSALDLSIGYKKSGTIFVPDFVFTVDFEGSFKKYHLTTKKLSDFKAFKDTINDTLPEGTDIDTLIKNPLKVFSISVIPGQLDSFVYVGTTEGVFKGTLKPIYYSKIDTLGDTLFYVYDYFYLDWTKIGVLTDTVTKLYVTNSFILAATTGGLMRWDGSLWTNVNSNIINSIKSIDKKLPFDTFLIGTGNGAYLSIDGGATWSQVPGFSGKNVVSIITKPSGSYPGAGNYFAVVRDSGVYDENGNKYIAGLEAFMNSGALKGYDIESDNYGRIWYACEAGLFYLKLKNSNYVWNFNTGIEEGYDPQDPSSSYMIGVNVADEIVDTFVSSFKSLFADTAYIDIEEIKKMFNEYFGSLYPEDTIHFVINPYLITPPDPDQSPPYRNYDIVPVGLFTLYDKGADTLQKLSDAFYVKVGFEPLGTVGGWLSFSEDAKKMIFDYEFVNRGLFRLKPKEDKLIRTGFALLLIGNYKLKTDSILYGDSILAYVPGLFSLSDYYDSTGTNVSMFNISRYHGWGEPEPNEFSRARVFTLFEYIKEKEGISKIRELFKDTSFSWDRLYPYISGWAIANAIDDFKKITPFPPELPTSDERYGVIQQQAISYSIYTHIPDGKTHTLKFSFPDDAFYYDPFGNWVPLLEVWVINYKVNDSLEIKKAFPSDTARNVYSITLYDTLVVNKQKIVVINLDDVNVYSTSRGRDTFHPHPVLMALHNPALDNFIDIYVWNNYKIYKDAGEEGTVVTIKEGDNIVEVIENLKPLAGEKDEALFVASYELPRRTTTYTLTAFTEDTTGNPVTVSLLVPVYHVRTEGGVFVSSDGSVKVKFPEGLSNSFLFTISEIEREVADRLIEGSKEGMSKVFVIGSYGKKLGKEFTVEIKDPSLRRENSSIYMYDSDIGWVPVKGIVDREEGKFVFETDRFGIFQVREGGSYVSFPVLKAPSIMKKGENRVSFYVPIKSNIKMALYDATGRRISEILKGLKEAGIYEVNVKFPASGVYFITAEVDGFSKIKKKVIVFESK